MIDYSMAGPLHLVVRAHAIVESNETPTAIGDGGMAFGILQIHPGFFHDYYGRTPEFPASNSDTWIEAEIKAVATYHHVHRFLTSSVDHQHLLVQAYNQGFAGVFTQGIRAPGYLARWLAAYQKISV